MRRRGVGREEGEKAGVDGGERGEEGRGSTVGRSWCWTGFRAARMGSGERPCTGGGGVELRGEDDRRGWRCCDLAAAAAAGRQHADHE